MNKSNRRHLGLSLAGLFGAALVITAIVAAPIQSVQTEGSVVPTARVTEGDVPVVVYATGDLRPLQAQTLVAPSLGGPLQILHIAATGRPGKAGDVVVEFERSQ